MTFSGSSVLTITATAGAAPGLYTLITGGNNIGGATLPTLNLPVGWAATVSISGNNDGDSLTNLQEYAFGTDPRVSSAASIAYTPGGNVTTPGAPVPLNLAVGEGVDYRAIFGRRKNHQAAGLTYSVQFSADFTTWVTSTATPTVLTGENSAGDIEAVSVPYPFFIPTASGHRKPTFFRVGVSSN